MYRRILVLVLVVLLPLLAACGPAATEAPGPEPVTEATEAGEKPPAEPAEPITIRVMHQFNDAESEKFAEIVAKFEAENPDIKVEVERNNEANYYDKLVTTILGGSAPDIARVEPPKAAQYIAAGYAANIDAYIPDEMRGQFFEGTLEPLIKDGSLYGLPQDVAVLVLFYRTDMFEAAGLAGPPTTWDELVSYAEALTEDTNNDGQPDIYGIGLFGGWGAFEFYPWFWQAGGEMLKEEDGKILPAFNSPEGVAALQFWVDLVKKYQVMPDGLATAGEDDVKGPFMAGQMAMFTSGPWTVASLKEATDIEGKWSIAPLPEGKEAASVLGGMDLILLQQSEQKEEAARFLNFWMQDEIQLDWAKSLSLLPVKKSLYADPFFQTDPLMQAFAATLEVARSRPTIPQAGEVDDLFGQAIQAALSGAKSPQEALDEAAQQAAEILEAP